MSKEKEIIIASNLSSGHFEGQIPLYSAKQISHYTDPSFIDYFVKVLIDESGGKLNIKQVCKRSDDTLHLDNKLLFKDETIILEDDVNIEEGDTVYFEHIGRVYCFFIKKNSDNSLQIPVLYELTRRFWQRYTLNEDIKIELASDEEVLKGRIVNFDINGLGISFDKGEPKLFDSYKLKIFSEDEPLEILGQIVHFSKTKDENIAGFYFSERKNKKYLEKFFWTNYKKYNPDIEELSENSSLEEVKKQFENVPIPQLFNEEYLKNTSTIKTIMLKKGNSYSSGISICKYNKKMTMMHTLVLQKEHLHSLPVNLYEYVANRVLATNDSEYFSGYWPPKNKYIDRGYTNFVKGDYDDVHHFYKQINIYNCEVNNDFDKQIIDSFNSNKDYVKNEIRKSLGDVFYDAFGVDEPEKDIKIISIGSDNNISGIAMCLPKRSDHGVFALSNQTWIIKADDLDAVKQLKALSDKYFQTLGHNNYNVHTFEEYKGIESKLNTLRALKEVHFWIANNTRVKAYINYLKRINFEISLLTSKKSISKKYVKFIKGFTSSFYKRKSLRYQSKELQNDMEVSFDTSFMSIDSVKVMDIDTFGMSAEISANLNIKDNTHIDIIFSLKGEEAQKLKGVVKYCKPKAVSGFKALNNHVGIEFQGLDLESKRVIREYCFRKLNPDLSMFSKQDFRSLVDLLEKSKYFEYYDSTKQRQFEEESEPIYSSLELLIPDLARVTVFKNDEDDSIIGTHAFYRRSNKTWQLHQLAVNESLTIYKAKFPTKVVLNGAFQYLCLDPDVDFVITYFHNDAAIAKTYFDVKNHHDNPKEYAYIEFTGFLFEGLDKKSYQFGNDYQLSVANEKEKKFLQKEVKNLVEDIEYEALEYANLSQKDLIKKWNKTGAIRDREVLLIKNKNGEILHFAICDVSPLGINFIGLVDIFRIFHQKTDEAPSAITMQLLANYAASYYKNKGRSQVYLEVDPNLGEYFNELEVRQLGKNWRLIAARNTFMTALQYFNSRFERLQQRLKQSESK
ncbi:PilZ domain-containing protein [bacterium]|nr:PilZ domain-containing protein [bacterium]